MTVRRLLAGLLLAAATHLWLETRAFTDIQRVRFRVSQAPKAAVDGAVRAIFSPEPTRPLPPLPLALIARVTNAGDAPMTSTLTVDGRSVCSAEVPAGETRRLDCAVEWLAPADDHALVIEGSGVSWQAESVELATHFGNTTGLNYLVVLPQASLNYRAPGRWLVLFAVTTVLAVVMLLPAAAWPARWRNAHRGLAVLVMVAGTAVMIAPWVSPYRIVVAAPTVALWMSILCLPWLWSGGAWLTRARRLPLPVAASRVLSVALLATIPFGLFVDDKLAREYDNNYSGFLKISRRAFEVNPVVRDDRALREQLLLLDNGGYDGQFAYFIAFDPLMRRFRDDPHQYRDMVDKVTYRFGRAGFSMLTRVLSGGDESRFPRTMVWLTLLGVLSVGGVFGAAAHSVGKSPAYGALVLLIPGFWQSVQTALPESLAAAALAGGALCLFHRRALPAALLFALSLFIRETGLVFVLLASASVAVQGRIREALAGLAIAVLPTVLWRLYVEWTMFPALGLSPLFDYPSDLSLPLGGIVDVWKGVSGGTYGDGTAYMPRAAISFSLLTMFGLAVSVCLLAVQPTLINLAIVAYGFVSVSLNYEMIWVHIGNAQRGTYEMFVLLALATTTMGSMPRWFTWALRLFWLATATYVFFLAYDAEAVRRALQPG